MSRTIIYVHVNIILDFPITYLNASVLSQTECACLYQTVTMAVFFFLNNGKELPKRESTHANVQSCPSNEKSEWTFQTLIQYVTFMKLGEC